MTEEEQVRQLQEELDALKKQLRDQHVQVNALQQRLQQLGGSAAPVLQPPPPVRRGWSLENFIGLKIIHFIGIVVLVIGLSIGVKYAIDRNLISEGLRIVLAYGAGAVLYGLSLRLRKQYLLFSAILFSGGMASLYFTTYGAYAYYAVFSFAVAFLIMIALTVYTVFEAIRYNRQEIALLGLTGAYGIPFLISQNADRADLFFLYISLINGGVVFLSIRKAWKQVGLVAQVITWILFIGWAAVRFVPRQQTTAILFLLFFFLLFLGMVAAVKLVHKKPFGVNDTYQLVLNNLALYIAVLFVFGTALEANADLPFITLAVSVCLAVQALLVSRSWKEEGYTARMLAGMGFLLFILFIAFNWDGFTVTLLWLLTAVVVFTTGFFRRSVSARMAAIILMGLTLGKLLAFDSLTFTTVQKVIAYLVLGVLLLVVSFFYQKFRQQLFSDDK